MKHLNKKKSILLLLITIVMSIITTSCNASQYGRFERISDLNVVRSSLGSSQLFLLRDGRVLVFGGDTSSVPFGKHGTRYEINKNVSAEIFDPKTNTFTLKKGLNHELNDFTATLLNNGKLLITGGSIGSGNNETIYNLSEIYDPETDTVTQGPDMSSPIAHHTAVLLKDGRVLVFGGYTGKRGNYSKKLTAEIYDPVQNKFILLKDFPKFASENIYNTWNPHVHVLSNGDVYILSIYQGKKAVYNTEYRFEVFDPKTNTFNIIKSDTVKNRNGITSFATRMLTLKNEKIVLFGIDENNGKILKRLDIYDPKTNELQNIESLNSKEISDTASITLLQDGNILITGYKDKYLTATHTTEYREIFDTKRLKFITIAKNRNKINCFPQTILLNDGRVLITGEITRRWSESMPKTSEVFIPINKVKVK